MNKQLHYIRHVALGAFFLVSFPVIQVVPGTWERDAEEILDVKSIAETATSVLEQGQLLYT